MNNRPVPADYVTYRYSVDDKSFESKYETTTTWKATTTWVVFDPEQPERSIPSRRRPES